MFFVIVFEYEMIGQEYPFGDMEPYDYVDAVKVQKKLRGMGVPAFVAEQYDDPSLLFAINNI
jgi:hypothetical protein